MQERTTSRLEVKEEAKVGAGQHTTRQHPLVRAFYGDPHFVRGDRRRHQGGEGW